MANVVNKVVVHNSTFHADDVFGVALVKFFLNEDVKVERVAHQADFDSIKSECEANGEVVWFIDVSRKYSPVDGYFDHHHEKSEIAAAGRVYNYLKEEGYISDRVAHTLDKLVRDIDLNDVGIKKAEIGEFSWTISQFNADNIYSDEQYDQFLKAVDVAVTVISGVVNAANKKDAAIGVLQDGIKFKLNESDEFSVLEISEFTLFGGVIHEIADLDDVDVVVWFDEIQNKWKSQTVPDAPGSFGKRGRAIKVQNPLPNGVEFVHVGEFFMVGDSKRDIIKYLDNNFK